MDHARGARSAGNQRFTREAMAQKWALETTSLPRFAGKNAGN
jgi:hypothetical protein